VTTIAISSHPRPNRNGRISALIVSMGLAVVLGVAMHHVTTAERPLVNASVSPRPSADLSEYRFVAAGNGYPWISAPPRPSPQCGVRGESFSPAALCW